MKDFYLTKANLQQVFDQLQDELEKHGSLAIQVNSGNTGKWGMARLWRSWMSTIGRWMAGNGATMPLCVRDGVFYGCRPFNAEDAHELFTSKCLGHDRDGNRLSWSKKGRSGMRPATQGERLDAMRKVEHWATERGIQLLQPRDSEYQQLKRKENGE